jgi:NTE family protein
MSKKIGIALGGGGARGFAHLGIVKALLEKGIEPSHYSGVSAGAIAGALLADGMSPDEAHRVLKDKGLFNLGKIHFPTNGLLKFDGLQEELEKALKAKKIEDLKLPLTVAASNLNKAKVEYFSSGNLAQIVTASASIPILFTPVEIDGNLYSDGGMYDNLPTQPLRDEACDKIIAISISPVNETNELDSLKKIGARVFQLMVNANTKTSKTECDLLIEPDGMRDYDILSSSAADELFELGYAYTSELDLSDIVQ